MRYLVSLVLGLFIAGLLFALMHYLVSGTDRGQVAAQNVQFVDFVRVKRNEQTRTKERQVPEKPEPPKKPPPPQISAAQTDTRPQPPQLNINMPNIGTAVGGAGPYLGNPFTGMSTGDGDVIPIVQVEPRYPREAARNCLSGEVLIELTILEDGSVASPQVVESNPPRVFDREALRAVAKWKFKPRIIDGRPVARQARVPIEFPKPEGC